jgi:hypothetical protein
MANHYSSIFGHVGNFEKFDDVIFRYVHFRIGNFYAVNRCSDIPLLLPQYFLSNQHWIFWCHCSLQYFAQTHRWKLNIELIAFLKINIKEQDLVRIILKYIIALFTFLKSNLCLLLLMLTTLYYFLYLDFPVSAASLVLWRRHQTYILGCILRHHPAEVLFNHFIKQW